MIFSGNLAKKKLEIISFEKDKNSNVSLSNIKKLKRNSILVIQIDPKNEYNFKVNNNLLPYVDNILASLAILKSLEIVNKLGINFFLNTKYPMVEEILKKYMLVRKK